MNPVNNQIAFKSIETLEDEIIRTGSIVDAATDVVKLLLPMRKRTPARNALIDAIGSDEEFGLALTNLKELIYPDNLEFQINKRKIKANGNSNTTQKHN